ncbi:MAG: sensor histidine kinase [Cellulomonadaceae bacterium]
MTISPEPDVRPPRPGETSPASVLAQNAPFFAVLGLLALATQIIDITRPDAAPFLASLVLLCVAVLLAVALPWRRLPPLATAIIPVLALIVLGLVCVSGPRVALAGVLPVITLARHHGKVGVVAGMIGGTAVSWADQIARPTGIVTDTFPRLVLLPIVLSVVAVTIAEVERRSQARASLLARQGGELQRTVEDLVAERARIDAVVSSLSAGVIVLDPDGGVALANPVIEAMTDRGVRVGDSVRALAQVPGDDVARNRIRALALRAHAGESIDGETGWWTMPDGTHRALRTTTSTFRTSGTRGDHRVILVEDLTAEESAQVDREAFINSVSHELRTPLTSIIGHLELAADDGRTPQPVQRSLDIAERNANRLLRLVNDLLADAALRHGRAEESRGTVDLADIVADAVFAAQPRADAAGLTITYEHTGDALVHGDCEGLGQVLDNLLSNAVKYSSGGGYVQVRLARDGDLVRLEVEDQGIGISEADQAHLFERFFRAEAVRDTARQGTGLGLSITRQILEAHGGTIELISRLDRGTTARVTLPALVGAADRPGATARRSS